MIKDLPSLLSRSDKSFKPSDLGEGTAFRDCLDAINRLERPELSMFAGDVRSWLCDES